MYPGAEEVYRASFPFVSKTQVKEGEGVEGKKRVGNRGQYIEEEWRNL